MSFKILSPGPQMRAELYGDLTIAEAAETRDALALALATSEKLELDLGGLENIDVAGLQILIALANEPHPLRLCKPSSALLRMLTMLRIATLDTLFVH